MVNEQPMCAMPPTLLGKRDFVIPCGDGQTEKTHGGKMGVEERGSFGVGFLPWP